MKSSIDEYVIRKAQARRAVKVRQHQADIESLMQDARFRRVVWSWISQCRCFEMTFSNKGPQQSALNEGIRKAGTDIMNEIGTIDPLGFMEMQKQNHENQRNELELQHIDRVEAESRE